MIKRNSPNNITPSLVNTAQSEHFNVTEAIRADAPITSTKSVLKSINFENASDGSYIIRKPIILKERLSGNKWYLYDNTHILNLYESSDNQYHVSLLTMAITGSPTTISLRYYDKSLNYKIKADAATILVPYIKKVLNVYNAPDHTLLSIILDTQAFTTTTQDDLVYSSTHYQVRNAHEVYRFIKIYKNLDTETDSDWIVEIIHPEFNSITSGMDAGNPNTLDINLVLDNPYAIRDLYGYGYNSATKIITYMPIDQATQTEAVINELPVYMLTEDCPYLDNGTQKGFKVLVSTNPVDLYGKRVVLKACITTAVSTLDYYCCWEQSVNGIDWETCPDFISKFETNNNNLLAEILVSDITSAEFEKVAYEDSLDKAATYLVKKKVVKLNPSKTVDLNETDLIKNRADVLVVNNPKMTMYYRFQIFVDTGKGTPVPETITKTLAKSYFESVGQSTAVNIDSLGKFTYQTYVGRGVDSDVPSGTPTTHNPEVVNGSILLYESDTASYMGNYIYIKCTDSQYTVKNIRILLDNKTYHAEDENHLTSYYTEKGTFLKYITNPGNRVGNIDVGGGNEISGLVANDTASIDIPSGVSDILIGNGAKDMASTLPSGDSVFQYRTKIKSIEIDYEIEGTVQTTSIYLTSTTGSYKFEYSNSEKYLEDLSLLRKQLFTSNIYYNKEQFWFYGNNTLFSTDLGSYIIKLMNTMTFGTLVTNIIAYRNYLLVFTETSITLLKYNSEEGTYDSKIITTAIGVPEVDSRTIAVILNSIYFKSKYKVYKLVPNLYASNDDILNIHTISTPIDSILESLLSLSTETSNFCYADASSYRVFLPLQNINGSSETTYEIRYDYNNKLWTVHQYPVLATGIEIRSITEAYLRTDVAAYYFKEDLGTLLNSTLVEDLTNVGCSYEHNSNTVTCSVGGTNSQGYNVTSLSVGNSTYTSMTDIYDYIPYGDLLNMTLVELYNAINQYTINATTSYISYIVPIEFNIDFGQKSSNYTLDKQFLESKLIFACMHVKDIFPVTLDIQTDGIQRPLHWDVNTDSALWKTNVEDVGTLSTDFGFDKQDYNGIFRQLIVKYSGKGKTIRHLIRGTTKTRFKFYSMDVRSRILPVKQ